MLPTTPSGNVSAFQVVERAQEKEAIMALLSYMILMVELMTITFFGYFPGSVRRWAQTTRVEVTNEIAQCSAQFLTG